MFVEYEQSLIISLTNYLTILSIAKLDTIFSSFFLERAAKEETTNSGNENQAKSRDRAEGKTLTRFQVNAQVSVSGP